MYTYTGTMADFFPELLECNHELSKVEVYSEVEGRGIRNLRVCYHMKCGNCGKVLQRNIKVKSYP